MCQNFSIVFQCFSSSKWDSLKFMGQTHSNSQLAEVWFGSTEFSEESSNVRVTSVSPVIRLQHAFRCLHGDVLVQFLHSSVLQTAAVSITLSVSIIATIQQNPQTYSSSNCRLKSVMNHQVGRTYVLVMESIKTESLIFNSIVSESTERKLKQNLSFKHR